MERPPSTGSREILAIKVHQWLREWDQIEFSAEDHRERPSPYFYVFSMSAAELKALTGVQIRTTKDGLLRTADLGIQRRHDKKRSNDIAKFVRYGGPYSELGEVKQTSGQFNDLRKPGWLPTAIVVNILERDDVRQGRTVTPGDVIEVQPRDDHTAIIRLPEAFTGAGWGPATIHPIEVIDGQHRLWAFEDLDLDGKFELPVVAFHGLDRSWQAYLFWTINIKPKRINASLAFDLYPLLRTEDWLTKSEGIAIYRETRAQELTQYLWAYSKSPWYHRINMLGESGLKRRMVSQAAWIRSLMSTYVKAWEGQRVQIGGLFGSKLGSDQDVLPWGRAQQAAFLILMGMKVRDAIQNGRADWAEALRHSHQPDLFEDDLDPAFSGPYSLLSTDQGIRGLLYVTNDLCYLRAGYLKLDEWVTESGAEDYDEGEMDETLSSLESQPVSGFLRDIAASLATFDWRASSTSGLDRETQVMKAALRGSGGYRELRRQLLTHLADAPGDVGGSAKDVLKRLGYA